MNVLVYGPTRLVRIVHHSLKSPLQQRSVPSGLTIEPTHIGKVEPLDRPAQMQPRSLYLEMIVIGHEHISMQSHPKTFRKICQQFLEFPIITFVRINSPPFDSTGHYVIPCPWYYNSKWPRHCRSLVSFLRQISKHFFLNL